MKIYQLLKEANPFFVGIVLTKLPQRLKIFIYIGCYRYENRFVRQLFKFPILKIIVVKENLSAWRVNYRTLCVINLTF